jgi:hypothetical protein
MKKSRRQRIQGSRQGNDLCKGLLPAALFGKGIPMSFLKRTPQESVMYTFESDVKDAIQKLLCDWPNQPMDEAVEEINVMVDKLWLSSDLKVWIKEEFDEMEYDADYEQELGPTA